MPVQPAQHRLSIIIAHVLVWVFFGIAIFFYHPLFSGVEIPYQAWVKQAVTLILLVIIFYINVAVLVPRFLLRNQLFYYSVMVIALVATTVMVNRWVEDTLDDRRSLAANMHEQQTKNTRFSPGGLPRQRRPIDRPTILISALVLGIGTSITVIQKWQKDKQQREELEKEKISSELSFLKAQINPHFFFNTLNNIYALTQVDAAQAGNAIHRLSRMMRYLLYETQQGETLLSQEIAFVQDYISLMQLRLTDAVKLTIDISCSFIPDLPMAPMVLLPFVENAFKHGVSATQASEIDIIIQQSGSQLDVSIKNSIIKDNNISLDSNSGIGLQNTRRRLDLLYPGKYILHISRPAAGTEYQVHLMLDLL